MPDAGFGGGSKKNKQKGQPNYFGSTGRFGYVYNPITGETAVKWFGGGSSAAPGWGGTANYGRPAYSQPAQPTSTLGDAWRAFLGSLGIKATNQGMYGTGVMPTGGYPGVPGATQPAQTVAPSLTGGATPTVQQKITREPYNWNAVANYGAQPPTLQSWTPAQQQMMNLWQPTWLGGGFVNSAAARMPVQPAPVLGGNIPAGWTGNQVDAWQRMLNDTRFGRWTGSGWDYGLNYDLVRMAERGVNPFEKLNKYGQPVGTLAPLAKKGGRAGGGMGYAVKQGPTVKPPEGWTPKKKGGGGNYPTTSTGTPPVGAAWGFANWRP